MENINWSSFKKRIVVEKPVADIYAAWATKAKIETWFLEKANYYDQNGNARKPDAFIQKGDSFSWKWNNWDFEEKGEILAANGKDFLSFTFGAGGNVHIELKPHKNGTEVILTQDDIPTNEHGKKEYFVGCSTGWTFWLANLKAWAEHGITLHARGLRQDETKDLVNS